MKELESVAESLLTVKEPVNPPASVVRAAKRAVLGRTRCSEWYSSRKGNVAEIESHHAHNFFNKCLQGILGVLEQLCARHGTTQENNLGKDTLQRTHDANPFSQLRIEDGELTIKDVSDFVIADKSTEVTIYEAPEIDFEHTLEAPDDEWFFATFCLLTDVHSIEEYITSVCLEFQQGKCSNATLSVTANAAVDLVGTLLTRFYESNPRFAGSSRYLDEFEAELRKRQGKRPKPERMISIDDEGYLVFSKIRWTLEEFRSSLGDASYNRTADSMCTSSMEDMGQARVDMAVLMDAMKDSLGLIFISAAKEMPIVDKLTYCVLAIAGKSSDGNTGEVLLHSIFAASLYLNMHHILGTGRVRGLQELQMAAKRHRTRLAHYWEFATSSWGVQGMAGEAIHKRWQILYNWMDGWVTKDIILESLLSIMREAGATSEEIDHECKAMGSFRLFSNHSWLCGAIRFSLDTATNEIAILEWQRYCFGRNWAHIYNAALLEGLVDTRWDDMEHLFQMHPGPGIYAGTRPNTRPTTQEGYKVYRDLADNVSIAYRATDRKKAVRRRNRSKAPVLQSAAPISMLCFKRTQERPEILTFRPAVFEAILEEMPNAILRAQSKAGDADGGTLNIDNGSQPKRQDKADRQWIPKCTSLQLLQFLKQSLVDEEPALEFDYLTLNQRCYRMAQPLFDELDAMWRTNAQKLDMPPNLEVECKRDGAFYVTSAMVLDAMGKFRNNPSIAETPLIESLTRLLKETIKSEGDTECKKLKHRHELEQIMAKKHAGKSFAPPIQTPTISSPKKERSNEEEMIDLSTLDLAKKMAIVLANMEMVHPVSATTATPDPRVSSARSPLAEKRSKEDEGMKEDSVAATMSTPAPVVSLAGPSQTEEILKEERRTPAPASRTKPGPQKKMAKGLADLY